MIQTEILQRLRRDDDMFREMRRFKQALSKEDCIKILEGQNTGVLAVNGDGGYPYAVPMSYVYADDKIYFHSAKSGHKNDAIAKDPRVSFCVTETDKILSEDFTSRFRSVIAFGEARMIESDEEKRRVMEVYTKKYSPLEPQENADKKIAARFAAVTIIEMDIQHLSGKESMDLVKMR